jgi:hypothetical protein
MAVQMLRILPSSIQNHSLNAFRGTGEAARRMKTAIPNTTPASSSTKETRRAATFARLKLAKPETQS